MALPNDEELAALLQKGALDQEQADQIRQKRGGASEPRREAIRQMLFDRDLLPGITDAGVQETLGMHIGPEDHRAGLQALLDATHPRPQIIDPAKNPATELTRIIDPEKNPATELWPPEMPPSFEPSGPAAGGVPIGQDPRSQVFAPSPALPAPGPDPRSRVFPPSAPADQGGWALAFDDQAAPPTDPRSFPPSGPAPNSPLAAALARRRGAL